MDAKSNAHRNRFVITAVILATFFLIMMGIGGAILGDGNTPSGTDIATDSNISALGTD